MQIGCRRYGLRNSGYSKLVNGCALFCSPTASLWVFTGRNLSFSFCRKTACRRSWGAALSRPAQYHCCSLTSRAFVLGVGSSTSYSFSQRSLYFLHSKFFSCRCFRAHNHVHYPSSFRSAASLRPSAFVHWDSSSEFPGLFFFCSSVGRSVGYCSGCSAVDYCSRDFIGYFNICFISIAFLFSSFWVFLWSLFSRFHNRIDFDYWFVSSESFFCSQHVSASTFVADGGSFFCLASHIAEACRFRYTSSRAYHCSFEQASCASGCKTCRAWWNLPCL